VQFVISGSFVNPEIKEAFLEIKKLGAIFVRNGKPEFLEDIQMPPTIVNIVKP